METPTSSTIIKLWNLCALGSFIIFALLHLTRSPPQTPHNIEITITSPVDDDKHLPTSNIQIQQLTEKFAVQNINGTVVNNVAVSEPPPSPLVQNETIQNYLAILEPPTSSKVIEDGNSVNEEEDKCNIYDGKWVYKRKARPLYSGRRCPFLSEQVTCQKNRRPDYEYEKWSWEAKGCEIPRFNGTDMLERLRGKRVILVGDSLNRNQWQSLACLLYSAIHPSRAVVDLKNRVFQAKDYQCSVEFYWSPFLVELQENQSNGVKVLRLDKLSAKADKWKGANVMVFNSWHWWTHTGKLRAWEKLQYGDKVVEEMEAERAYQLAMNTWARWIDQTVDVSKTIVFFRSASAIHNEKKQWCHNSTKPIMDESALDHPKEAMTDVIERTIRGMKKPIRYLNITKLSEYRKDAHPSIYVKSHENRQKQPMAHPDCSHWCLPGVPDTWNRLLYASMVMDSSTQLRF